MIRHLSVLAALVALASGLGCGGGGGGGGGAGGFQREVVTTLTFPFASSSSLVAAEAFPSLPSFDTPVFVTSAPGDAGRLYVVEQPGRIRIVSRSPGATSYGTFLDLTSRVTQTGGEEGLLGLAFDPGYATNGELYVSYVAAGSTPRTSVIARYRRNGSDPTRADATEERLLTLSQPYTNHNGGMIAFGPDGYLYAGFGDGGSAGDPLNAGLDRGTLLGKLLRLDVHGTQTGLAYRIPTDNPFVGVAGARGEIWAYGFRNPWRFSFDRGSGALWAGDVGQGTREEIDVVTRGANYGWRAREGLVAFSAPDAGRGPFTDPLFDYPRSSGACVIGGYVYRGSALPALAGSYVYGDNSSGRIWALSASGGAVTRNQEIAYLPGLSSFGEDADGELYVCDHQGGRLRKLVAGGAGSDPFPQTLSATGLFRDTARQVPQAGVVPYDVNVPFWSDGAEKDRWFAVPGFETLGASVDGPWTFPVGSVLVKTFRLPLVKGVPTSAVKVETRVLLRTDAGWEGYVYRWRDDQSDADLLPGGATRTYQVTDPSAPGGTATQTWTFPSRADCARCHTAAAGSVLGLRTRQLHRSYPYAGGARNQLDALAAAGYLDGSLGSLGSLPAHPEPTDEGVPVSTRARAWLDVNCAVCHRPGGGTGTSMDLRVTTDLASLGVVGVAPQRGDLGVANARLVAPGAPERSVLWLRVRSLDANRMPPLGSTVVDADGDDLVARWIQGIPP